MDDGNQFSVTQQKPTRPRFQFTAQHKDVLEKVYKDSPYPDKGSKQQIATLIGATEIQVNEWFQRRRKKDPAILAKVAAGNTQLPNNATVLLSQLPTATTINSTNTVNAAQTSNASSSSFQGGFLTSNGTITSPFFPYNGHVNPPMPNHEVYVYIGDNQVSYNSPLVSNYNPSTSASYTLPGSSATTSKQTAHNENKSEKREDKNKSTPDDESSRQLIESIMPYLKPDLGLISSQVVHDFLHKVKDAPLSARGSILHIIDQTKDSETLKGLVNERACYLLRNWVKEEAKSPESDLLHKLLQTVNHLPIDTEALSASGLGRVINNTRVKDSQIPGVAELASLLINKWIEEKRRADEKASQLAAENSKSSATSGSSSTRPTVKPSTSTKPSNQPSHSSQNASSKALKGREAAGRVRPSLESKVDPRMQARPDTSLFDEILGNLNASKSARQTQINRVTQKDSKTIIPVKNKQTVQATQANEKSSSSSQQITSLDTGIQKSVMELVEDNLKENKKEVKTTTRKRKRVTFAPDNMLTQVKLFEMEERDYIEGEFSTVDTPHQFGNARDLDRSEGLTAFKRVRKAPAMQWYTPPMINLERCKFIKPKLESEEARIQEERERQILETIYITPDQVPPSPAEPDETVKPDRTKSREILLYEEPNEDDYYDRAFNDASDNDLDSLPISEELLRTLQHVYAQWQNMQLGNQKNQNNMTFSSNTGMDNQNIVQNLIGGRMPMPTQILPTPQQPPIQQPIPWNLDVKQPNTIINYHQQQPPVINQPSTNITSALVHLITMILALALVLGAPLGLLPHLLGAEAFVVLHPHQQVELEDLPVEGDLNVGITPREGAIWAMIVNFFTLITDQNTFKNNDFCG
ncbi:1424_t:CDS:2 [Acaulospora colombiana]|uniref:1424_t:CDS:1 n=1 Tax=Acaulospora colombiana TaxID=27376 RepID=A0ACA9L2T6_9GLOM|nr:1424_t:CDS:2 [Acaulospora colombiana]